MEASRQTHSHVLCPLGLLDWQVAKVSIMAAIRIV